MEIEFWKYQGNGNDFIILDETKTAYQLTTEQISGLCDRHFGIGADGLMSLQLAEKADFRMTYYNADGQLSSMCGNGGRCIAMFAYLKKLAPKRMRFEAFDGLHNAQIEQEVLKGRVYAVSLQMADVLEVEQNGKYYFLDTGSPHYVEFVENLSAMDVVKEGRITRFSERFAATGTNVNFVEMKNNRLFVRTYERGVEDETLSCGTGVTASAIAAFLESGRKDFQIQTSGGEFRVDFEKSDTAFTSVWLHGPATFVFKGRIELDRQL